MNISRNLTILAVAVMLLTLAAGCDRSTRQANGLPEGMNFPPPRAPPQRPDGIEVAHGPSGGSMGIWAPMVDVQVEDDGNLSLVKIYPNPGSAWGAEDSRVPIWSDLNRDTHLEPGTIITVKKLLILQYRYKYKRPTEAVKP